MNRHLHNFLTGVLACFALFAIAGAMVGFIFVTKWLVKLSPYTMVVFVPVVCGAVFMWMGIVDGRR